MSNEHFTISLRMRSSSGGKIFGVKDRDLSLPGDDASTLLATV